MSADNDDNRPDEVDLSDPKLSGFEVYREGLRRDGIEILHYEPRYPKPGTKLEKRMERIVASLFFGSGLFATLFVAAYIFWPWEYDGAATWRDPRTWYTPIPRLLAAADSRANSKGSGWNKHWEMKSPLGI